ncbi:MAG: hypothetical protein ABR577_01230 [Pyrinomonadaceae bacterium]
MKKKIFVTALALFTLTSISARQTSAQSCNNHEAFGVRQARPIDSTLQSQIEVTYFATDNPDEFISERAGIKRSASYTSLSTNQFVAQIGQLERKGLASIKKRQSATSFLGEMAELNLERKSVNANARMVNASDATSKSILGLDRETEVSVYKGSSIDGDSYRVRLVSSFVKATAKGAQKTVDYDASILLKPGQTAVFKLRSDDEVKRSGAARSYMAVTLRSVDSAGLASLGRRHTSR